MRRKPRLRPTIIPTDTYFLTFQQLTKLTGYNPPYFRHHVLTNREAYGLPAPVVLGPVPGKRHGVCENLRWRADECFSLRPDLDPWRDSATGVTSTWMERFRQRQRAEREAYIQSKKLRTVAA